MITISEKNRRAVIFFSIYFAAVPFACTNGVMNVGEPPFPSDTATVHGSSEQPVEKESDTGFVEITSTGDAECEDGGALYADYCWYLGERGESCLDVCQERGGYNESTAAIVGSPEQGGTWEACRDIIRLLGFEEEVGAGHREEGDNQGFGCHLWQNVIWWLYHPDLTPEARFIDAERICSCHGTNTP